MKMKNRVTVVLKWLPIVLLAVPMIAAGSAKLAGVPALHESFAVMGLPSWFGYFIGAAEVAGGIGLLIPRLSALAALGLAPIMGGAVYFHLAFAVPSFVPALVLLMLCCYVIAVRYQQTAWFTFKKAD